MKTKTKSFIIFLIGVIVGGLLSIPIYNEVRPISIYDTPECKNFVSHNPEKQLISKPYGKNKTFVYLTSTYDKNNEFYVFIGQKEGIFKNRATIHYTSAIDDDMLLEPDDNIPSRTPIQWSNGNENNSDLVYYGVVPQNAKKVLIDGKAANLHDMTFSHLDDEENDVKIKFYYLITEDTNGDEPNEANIEVKY